jgi:hypothetical protein
MSSSNKGNDGGRLLIEGPCISFYSTNECGWKVFWKGWVLLPVFPIRDQAEQYIKDLNEGKAFPQFRPISQPVLFIGREVERESE